MFRDLVLGILRDGRTAWAFGLMKEFRRRSGVKVNTGNFNRELKDRLAPRGMVQRAENPDGADPRRVPYRITEAGTASFDQWWLQSRMRRVTAYEDDLSVWALFVHLFVPEVVRQALEERERDLWWQGKELERDREAARKQPMANDGSLPVLELLLTRRIRHVAADLEFLEEVRTAFESWAAARERARDPTTPEVPGSPGRPAPGRGRAKPPGGRER